MKEPSMKVLFARRMGRRYKARGGGIYRSGELITQHLEDFGVEVVSVQAKAAEDTDRDDLDLVWVYGEYNQARHYIEIARKCGAPTVINSAYDRTKTRSRWLVAQMQEEWDVGNRGDVYLNVFTTAALDDPHLQAIKDRLVVVPKTIRVESLTRRPIFAKREGICLGELSKVISPRITGEDAPEIIERIRAGFPDIPLWVYRQHNQETGDIPGVTTAPYMPTGFHKWLGGMRLFVSLSRHETFAMVPLEAQSAGTPVLYRDLPQSLSHYIGPTGCSFQSIPELLEGIRCMYYDKKVWETFSKAGVTNTRACQSSSLAAHLFVSLRKVIARHRSPSE